MQMYPDGWLIGVMFYGAQLLVVNGTAGATQGLVSARAPNRIAPVLSLGVVLLSFIALNGSHVVNTSMALILGRDVGTNWSAFASSGLCQLLLVFAVPQSVGFICARRSPDFPGPFVAGSVAFLLTFAVLALYVGVGLSVAAPG